jgi:hypothetical protein
VNPLFWDRKDGILKEKEGYLYPIGEYMGKLSSKGTVLFSWPERVEWLGHLGIDSPPLSGNLALCRGKQRFTPRALYHLIGWKRMRSRATKAK